MRLRATGFWGISLALLLVVGSTTASVMRGKMRDVSGALVLCTGQGPVSVAVDSRGMPVEPLPFCPDYMPLMAGLLPQAALPQTPPCCSTPLRRGDGVPLLVGWAGGAVRVRGPPGPFVPI